jgi:hypothetical protein
MFYAHILFFKPNSCGTRQWLMCSEHISHIAVSLVCFESELFVNGMMTGLAGWKLQAFQGPRELTGLGFKIHLSARDG